MEKRTIGAHLRANSETIARVEKFASENKRDQINAMITHYFDLEYAQAEQLTIVEILDRLKKEQYLLIAELELAGQRGA